MSDTKTGVFEMAEAFRKHVLDTAASDKARAEALQQQLTQAHSALAQVREYAKHRKDCRRKACVDCYAYHRCARKCETCGEVGEIGECTCGLSAALDALKEGA